MEHNPLLEIMLCHATPDTPITMKDVETAAFEQGLVVINHRSTSVKLNISGEWHSQQPASGGILPAHSAVFIQRED